LEHVPADDFDPEVELERKEFVELLDRALALLPPPTRDVLVARYIEEAPQQEVARRFGISEGTVGVRLQRGKLYLRRVLTGTLIAEAAAYGLVDAAPELWQETRIWCPGCGRRRLMSRWVVPHAEIWTRCPDCDGPRGYHQVAAAADFKDIKGYKPAFSRQLQIVNRLHRRIVESRRPPCVGCGHPAVMRVWEDGRGYSMSCAHCGSAAGHDLRSIALALPEGRRFWSEHPRLHVRLTHDVETAGRRAQVVSLQSVTGTASMDVVFARDNFAVLGIHGAATEKMPD
ncbi:MAG: sigma-70 family RNA polymerase sigma factor, partial [Chloroflexota bacterium]|nr:sigma-70 family RNA polymerase sigma factor [Chloroflexota bacterium]